MWPSFFPYLWEAFAYRARVMVHPKLAKGWGPHVYRKLKHREGPQAPWVLSRTQPVGSQLAAFYFPKEAKKSVESEKKENGL